MFGLPFSIAQTLNFHPIQLSVLNKARQLLFLCTHSPEPGWQKLILAKIKYGIHLGIFSYSKFFPYIAQVLEFG